MSRYSVLCAAAIVALTSAGCRQQEANRPTAFTPGVYKGDPMPTLNAAQVDDLKKRGLLLR